MGKVKAVNRNHIGHHPIAIPNPNKANGKRAKKAIKIILRR
jgi:hypothetical protein